MIYRLSKKDKIELLGQVVRKCVCDWEVEGISVKAAVTGSFFIRSRFLKKNLKTSLILS